MKKLTIAVAVTLLGAALAFAAPHEGGKGFGHGRHGMFGEKLAQELGLSDAQKAQIKDIHKASREENKAFFEQAHATMRSSSKPRRPATRPRRTRSSRPSTRSARR